MRPIQKDGYLKMAACYNASNDTSSEQIQQCVSRASQPMQHVGQIVQNEMNQFQNRLERCSVACQDEAQDIFRKNDNQAAAEKAMMKCMSQCVDKHIKLIPDIQANLERSIDKVQK